jgi:hypothetical protein
MSPYERACAAIDAANEADPRRVEAEGKTWSQEVLYSRRMVEWAKRLSADPSEALLLAVRAQHLRRWTVPRSSYPEGREGYLRWREGLKKVHADGLAEFMKDAGYGEEPIAKARSLILRKQHAADPEGAVLEDAACLVFLQFEFAGFARRTEPERMIDILRKSWAKMSENGRKAALALPWGESEGALVRKALGG